MEEDTQRILSENRIKDKTSDFMAKYFAVYYLHSLAQTNPGAIKSETILILENLLKDPELVLLRQSLFLFREAAGTLVSLILNGNHLASYAVSALNNVLRTTTGHAHRATAESLGDLPFSVQGPEIRETPPSRIPRISWQRVLDETGFKVAGVPEFVGRSLVIGLDSEYNPCSRSSSCSDKTDKLLVIKLARAEESPENLFMESFWMNFINSGRYAFPVRFDIPEPVKIRGNYLFRIKHLSGDTPKNIRFHPGGYAIAFISDKSYFSYPNGSPGNDRPNSATFKEMMFRNALLLGNLTSMGIIHTALIPLFHNRVQQGRRRDNGLYEWFRRGRLDRWLESCEYPNIGMTGLRDFEHFISFSGSNRMLYRHIGSHFLSLLLVAGSFFRNKDRSRVGLDKNGDPADVRDLFDSDFLKKLVRGLFLNYYQGFTGTGYNASLPFDTERLVFRMIEEMGVDRYMEEFLRIPDQNAMTDERFRDFLKERGYSEQAIDAIRKGEQDIVIQTGPHLGGFNREISLPELIEAVETMAAVCMAGRFHTEHSTIKFFSVIPAKAGMTGLMAKKI